MVTHSGTSLRTDRLRALNLPSRVDVEVDARGLPVAIVESGEMRGAEGQRGREIENIVEVWRVDDEWWRRPIKRRYVEVLLEGGAHVVLFEDEVTGEWFIQKP